MSDYNFKIGDKVMADFGSYEVDLRVDEIIGETKTLWKCRNFSFSKTGFHKVYGHGDFFHPAMVRPLDEEKYNRIKYKQKLEKDYINALGKVRSIKDDHTKDKFVEWVKNNL